MNSRTKVVYLLVLLLLISTCVSTANGNQLVENESWDTSLLNNGLTQSEITSSKGIVYKIKFHLTNYTVIIQTRNTKHKEIRNSAYGVSVDGYTIDDDTTLHLEAGEFWSKTINITSGLNALERKHTLTVSTVGNYTQFNFTKEIDSSNPGPVLTPYIEDVEVTNGTIDGEPSSVANVTLVNPSIQTYPTKLMVHTHGTDGSFYGASVRPGGRTTITVELLDERGSSIAGEARLYAGNLSAGDGAMDQVEFVGRAGEETKTWNKSYEPVKGPWQGDGYEYRNKSLVNEPSLANRLSGGITVWGVPVVYPITGLVILMGFIRWRR